MSITHDTQSVTAVIPCFNQARYLAHAIKSVRAQRGYLVQCIVVDDGSTDNTAAVAATSGVQLIQQRNSGVSAARNAGLAASTSDLILFLDADDELLPDAVALGAEALRTNTHAALAVGRCQPIDSAGRELPVVHQDIDEANLYNLWLTRNLVWTPGAAIFRREPLAALGGFPADIGPAADYAVYLEFARTGRVVILPKVLVRYRQHESSMSRDPASMLRATVAVLRRERRAGLARPWQIRRARAAWCEWYGQDILDDLRKKQRAGIGANRQIATAATVVRYCPKLVLRHAARKVSRVCARLFVRVRARISQLSAPRRGRTVR